jgi:hypothetical protein
MRTVRKILLGTVLGMVLLLGVVGFGLWIWQERSIERARAAVTTAAQRIAAGETPPNVRFDESIDRAALARAFGSGFTVTRFDSIVFSFTDYEVTVETPRGDVIDFDAFGSVGPEEHLDCCNAIRGPGLYKQRGAPQ